MVMRWLIIGIFVAALALLSHLSESAAAGIGGVFAGYAVWHLADYLAKQLEKKGYKL